MDHLQLGWKVSLNHVSQGSGEPIVTGRRVPVPRQEFEILGELPDEGTFMEQFEQWCPLKLKVIALQNGEVDEDTDMCEVERLKKGAKRAHRLRQHESGSDGIVQHKSHM